MTGFTPGMSVDVKSASLDLAHETEQYTCPPGSHLLILWGRRKKDGPERSRKHVLKRSDTHCLGSWMTTQRRSVSQK